MYQVTNNNLLYKNINFNILLKDLKDIKETNIKLYHYYCIYSYHMERMKLCNYGKNGKKIITNCNKNINEILTNIYELNLNKKFSN